MFAQQKQIPRSPFASAITAVVHGALGVVVWGASGVVAELPKSQERMALVIMLAPPARAIELPPPVDPAPTPRPTPALPPPPSPERPTAIETDTRPARPAEERVAENVSPPPPPAEAQAPPKQSIVVGAFADRVEAVARRRSAPREVQVSGFDSSLSRVPVSRPEVGAVGSFESSSPGRAVAPRSVATGSAGFAVDDPRRPERSPVQSSGETGFATPAAPAPRRAVSGTSVETGFDNDVSRARAPVSAPREVTTTGFAEPAPSPAQRPAAAPQQTDRSVEVVYKPRPEYTDEARRLQIEGEVVLEVEFTADGLVRVLRVARGLGYGLDEMASRAVQQIRFTPALRNGVPVTSRASVNIVFRLT
jgi:TonB family protein